MASSENEQVVWFKKVAATVRDIVDVHGGAIVMTREELQKAISEHDPEMGNCPQMVFDHMTCSLRRENLATCAYSGIDPNVLMIFDFRLTDAQARYRCERIGLSAAVKCYMKLHELIPA